MDKYEALKYYFGHASFRQGQEKIIDSLLAQRDALCVMPTGAGKSVCYQIPAVLSDGITLVISPLISLMKDQVAALNSMGIRAAYLNSSLTAIQFDKALANASAGMYKIIYVAPERLSSERFVRAFERVKISVLAVDESHCISQWGQDFRPSYLHITDFVRRLPYRPVIGAFTATATDEVKEDIEKYLGLNNPFRITTGFDRPNLYFDVRHPADKIGELLEELSGRRNECGIIYCGTRKDTERVCDILCENGYDATMYHAGLTDDERRINQDDFIFDRKKIIVATNAFGMGIDKSNVAYVIHFNMPKSIESYYQEAGRAGRDGSSATCILFYSARDVAINKYLIENGGENENLSEEEKEEIKQKDYKKLNDMTAYCHTEGCLREYILRYFGDTMSSCSGCSNCDDKKDYADVSSIAKLVISAVDITGERFGRNIITSCLLGSYDDERIKKYGFDSYSIFGCLSTANPSHINAVINSLIVKEYLHTDEKSGYPVLKLTESSAEVLDGSAKVYINPKRLEECGKTGKKNQRGNEVEDYSAAAFDNELFERLKKLRNRIADILGIPAYIVFSDNTLKLMAARKPKNEFELLSISGVGQYKLEKYGKKFLNEINKK